MLKWRWTWTWHSQIRKEALASSLAVHTHQLSVQQQQKKPTKCWVSSGEEWRRRHRVGFCCLHKCSEHPHCRYGMRFSASQKHSGGCGGTELGTKPDHGRGAAAAGGETGKAVSHVLVRMLVLTRERRCVGAGMKAQWWRKCWTASFGSCDGFWLLKTNVKAVWDCILEADQSISSSFANMVQSKSLMH